MQILGLDVGGANLKAATLDGRTATVPFPLWQQPDNLSAALRTLIATFIPQPQLVAVTMTGELADCFESRPAGVRFIIQAVNDAVPNALVRIWMTSGEFAEPDDARELPELVAAANWHALATWAARAFPKGPSVLLDVGSTTTDLIPLLDGLPASEGQSDLGRLQAGELVYTGATRTPVCAVVRHIRAGGCHAVPVAAELFATMRDVYLITGELDDDETCRDTADGRPATRDFALSRLARMLCCDRTDLADSELLDIACQVAAEQQSQIQTALVRVMDRCRALVPLSDSHGTDTAQPFERLPVILSGSGAFIAESVVRAVGETQFSQVMSLSSMYHHDVSIAACAFAVARLAAERCLDDLLPLLWAAQAGRAL